MRFALTLAAILAGLVVHAGIVHADDADDVRQAASQLDQAFTGQDAALIESMVTSDHLAATPYYRRALTIAEQIETLDAFKARLFDVTGETVDLLGDSAAVITFEKSYEGTFMGEALPARVFVSSLWEKHEGQWLQRLYQETAIDPGQ